MMMMITTFEVSLDTPVRISAQKPPIPINFFLVFLQSRTGGGPPKATQNSKLPQDQTSGSTCWVHSHTHNSCV